MRKFNLSNPVDDPVEVFRFLYPQDRKYNSNVSLFYLNGKTMNYLDKVHPADLANAIAEHVFYMEHDYYITANTFARNYGRAQATLFSLNNIVIDIDMHTIDQLFKSEQKTKPKHPKGYMDLVAKDGLYDNLRPQQDKIDELCQELCWRLRRDLFCDMPPNIVHLTGRGIQFWWHLEETSKQLLWLYQQVCDKVLLLLDDFLCENPDLQNAVKIDRRASKNTAGLFRLFGTYNTKTNSQSWYEIIHRNSYTLNGLKVVLDELLESKEVNQAKEHHSKATTRRKNTNTRRKSKNKKSSRPRTAQLKRKWIIEQFVAEQTNHVGMRNNIMYAAFHNICLITSLEDARQYCHDLNQQFSEPLPSIDYIINHPESMPFKDTTFCDLLGISKDQFDAYSATYYATHRNDARSLKTQARKEEKNQRYAECQQLREQGYSLRHISKMTGVSLSSIKRHTIAPANS